MNCAHASQLQTSKVQKILQILDATKSTTERAFQKLVKDVALAKREAEDIHLHLLPLSNLLERCKGVSTAMPDGPSMHALPFDGLMSLFRPVLHVISLIYSNSEFFCNTARLQSILEKFCNDVIHAVLQVVNGAKVVGSYPLCHLMHPDAPPCCFSQPASIWTHDTVHHTTKPLGCLVADFHNGPGRDGASAE